MSAAKKRPKYERQVDEADDRAQLAKLDPLVRTTQQQVYEEKVAKFKRHISPAGALNLPPLLEKRRLELDIIDEAFDLACAGEFVMLWQIKEASHQGDTYGDSSIIMTEQTKDREGREAPRGVVVAAGLKALDGLRSNGIDLGHIVMHTHNAPYFRRIAIINGTSYRLVILQAGDIVGSEDLAQSMRSGDAKVVVSTDPETQFDYHYFQGEDGKVWRPTASFRSVI